VAVVGVTVIEPDVALGEKFVPVHELAFALFQVRVEDCPSKIDVGFADSEEVGAG
jgi:hypothetical protein